MKADWVSECGRVRLWNADCLRVLPTLEAGSVDAVVTDPPYGLELGSMNNQGKSNGYGGHLAKAAYATYEDTYENFIGKIVPRLTSAISLVPRAAVFTGPHIQEQSKATSIGGIFHPAASGRTPWGSKNFLPILLYGNHFHPGQHRPTVITSSENAEPNGHPCPKPLGWMTWLVEASSRVAETILDPFMGSGTTGVAAVRLGRSFLGCEIDPTYFAIAVRRIQAELESTPLLDSIVDPEQQTELFTGEVA